MCMRFKIKRIVSLNKKFGGSLINKSNLDFAVSKANMEKNIYKRNAHILRGIIVNHPFLDGNKRTAVGTILKDFKQNKYSCDKKKLAKGIVNIAKQNQGDINIISRRLRKWCLKK